MCTGHGSVHMRKPAAEGPSSACRHPYDCRTWLQLARAPQSVDAKVAVNLLERYFEAPKKSFKVGYPNIEQNRAAEAALATHGAITADRAVPRKASQGDKRTHRIWGKVPGKPSFDEEGRPLFKKSRRNKHLFTEESRLERVRLMRESEAQQSGGVQPQAGPAARADAEQAGNGEAPATAGDHDAGPGGASTVAGEREQPAQQQSHGGRHEERRGGPDQTMLQQVKS